MVTIKFEREVTTSGQPSAKVLAQLGLSGWKCVVNFRVEGEEANMPPTATEAEAVEAAGAEYRHFPVAMKHMQVEMVDRFLAALPTLPRPLLAHCQSGKRAAAMVLIDEAIRHRLTGLQALRLGEAKGIEWDHAELRDFVAAYVNSHSCG